jgi:hypothetical protein
VHGARAVELGDPVQVGAVEAVAVVDLPLDAREQRRPRQPVRELLAPDPRGRPQVLGRLPPADVAHQLDAGDDGHVVTARLDLRRRREHGQAPRRTRGIVPAGGQRRPGRVERGEQRPEVGLTGEQLGGEVADVRGLHVGGEDVGVGQRSRDGLGEHVPQRLRGVPRPVAGEVGLRAAEHEHLLGHALRIVRGGPQGQLPRTVGPPCHTAEHDGAPPSAAAPSPDGRRVRRAR